MNTKMGSVKRAKKRTEKRRTGRKNQIGWNFLVQKMIVMKTRIISHTSWTELLLYCDSILDLNVPVMCIFAEN